jgi:hypothetical protein
LKFGRKKVALRTSEIYWRIKKLTWRKETKVNTIFLEKGNKSKHNLLLRKVSEKKEQQELQYFHQFEIFL